MMPCCNKARYVRAWVWFWPFKAKYCASCGDVIMDMPGWLEALWRFFVWPFWDGRVKVEEAKTDAQA